MKIVAVCLLIVGLYQRTSAQTVSLESEALKHVLAQWPSTKDSSQTTIWVNKTARQTMPLSYFKDRRWWHIKGILSTNCYAASDSVANLSFAKQKVELFSDHPTVKWIRKKKQKWGNGLSLYVYKRFYYCDKIYVLITGVGSPFSAAHTELLSVFDRDGRFLTIETFSGVF